jgi:hypothetical protein
MKWTFVLNILLENHDNLEKRTMASAHIAAMKLVSRVACLYVFHVIVMYGLNKYPF